MDVLTDRGLKPHEKAEIFQAGGCKFDELAAASAVAAEIGVRRFESDDNELLVVVQHSFSCRETTAARTGISGDP
jgi:hypothetical protein